MVTLTPREVPSAVVRAFFRAMRDYCAERDKHRRDAIASHQLAVLRQYQGSRESPLRLSDIKTMFRQMR